MSHLKSKHVEQQDSWSNIKNREKEMPPNHPATGSQQVERQRLPPEPSCLLAEGEKRVNESVGGERG